MMLYVTTQQGKVIFVDGNTVIDIDGAKKKIVANDYFHSGAKIYIEDNTQFIISYADGSIYSNNPTTDPAQEQSNLASIDEIQSLQNLIESGEDPTLELPETTAGGSGNEGGFDFTSLIRTADETLAASGHDTKGFQFISAPVDEDPLSTLEELPTPSLSSSSLTFSESQLPQGSTPTNNELNQMSSIFFTPQSGILSLSINGEVIFANGVFEGPLNLATASGLLTITGLNINTGLISYSYTLNSAFNHTETDIHTDIFTLSLVNTQGETASSRISINLLDDNPSGQNDLEEIDEDTSLVVGDVLNNDTLGADSANITQITNSTGESNSVFQSTVISGSFGTLTISADGSYTYQLSTELDTVQSLTVGEIITEIFTYQLTDSDGDSTELTLSINIRGTNDAPIITPPDDRNRDGYDAGTTIESGNLDDGTPVAGVSIAIGTLEATDVDNQASLNWSGNTSGLYGTFTIDATTGEWVYTLDNNLADSLIEGQVIEESFIVTVTDEFDKSDTHTVIITINGTNDSPVITSQLADATGMVQEVNDPNVASASGTLTATDVDTGAILQWSGNDISALGGFTIDPDTGTWTYTLNNSAADYLAEGEQVVETFLVTVIDEFDAIDTQIVTITITGTNDAPVITPAVDSPGDGYDTGTATEAGNLDDGTPVAGVSTATGTLEATDVDNQASLSWSGNTSGAFGAFTIDTITGEWVYTLDNNLADSLIEGQVVEESFIVTVTDEFGESDTHTVTITINGTNDSPIITSTAEDASGDVLEAGVQEGGNTPEPGTLQTAGILTAHDVDQGAILTWYGNAAGTYGNFSIDPNTGSWTYLLNDNDLVDSLASGEQHEEIFLVTVIDEFGAITTQEVTVLVTGTNDLPILNLDDSGGVTRNATTPNLNDTGILSFSDVDTGDTHTISESYLNNINWSGGLISDQLSAAQITSLIDGFSVDINGWDYTILNTLVQFLAEDETITLSFNVTVTDNNGAYDTETVNIAIYGTNDDPVLIVTPLGSVTEDASNPMLNDSGTLSYTDGNATDTHTVIEIYNSDINWNGGALESQLSTAEIASLIDGFNVNNSGWTYSIPNALVQFLALGETITLSFNITVTDNRGGSDTELVTITINGTNDNPVLTTDTTGSVTEDLNVINLLLSDSGNLSFTDVDVTDTHTVSQTLTGPVLWSDGSLSQAQIDAFVAGFSVDNSGWGYNIDNSLVQFLALGETIALSFDVTVTDNDGGSDTQTVSLTINGTNDEPVLTVDISGSVTEDDSSPNLTDSGTLSFTDVDVNNTHSTSEVYNSDISWSHGTLSDELSALEIQSLIDGFTVDSDNWDYSILNSLVQFLALGETITLSFDVTVTDNDGGSDTQTVSLTINGTNDEPVLTVDISGSVTEDNSSPNLTDSGALSFTDVDVNNTHSTSEMYNSDISWSHGTLSDELSALEIQSLIDGFSFDSNGWDYSILNSLVQFLALGETITLSFDVTVTDNDGGSDTQTVSLTINGTNDEPVLTVDISGSVTEDDSSPNLTDSGTLSFTDVDVNNTHSTSEVYNSDISWSHGTLSDELSALEIQSLIDGFSFDSNGWDYSILNSLVQFLALGETITLSFVLTVTDNDASLDT
ncbi:VCBS domain-containing protein [Shewanella woodyi]|uniref:VCBS domain-containing protein n=1 Tax=Shewanella woodyi TaxID=60961 RepID=UPI0007F962E9|nr:VCBS domain-containing protein [Shewanella woodyi]